MSLRSRVLMTQNDTEDSGGSNIDPVLNAEISNFGINNSDTPPLASSAGAVTGNENPVQTVGTNYSPSHSALNYNPNNQTKFDPNNGLTDFTAETIKRIENENKENSSKKDFSSILYLVCMVAALLIIKKIFF